MRSALLAALVATGAASVRASGSPPGFDLSAIIAALTTIKSPCDLMAYAAFIQDCTILLPIECIQATLSCPDASHVCDGECPSASTYFSASGSFELPTDSCSALSEVVKVGVSYLGLLGSQKCKVIEPLYCLYSTSLGCSWPSDINVGNCTLPSDCSTFDDLISRADGIIQVGTLPTIMLETSATSANQNTQSNNNNSGGQTVSSSSTTGKATTTTVASGPGANNQNGNQAREGGANPATRNFVSALAATVFLGAVFAF